MDGSLPFAPAWFRACLQVLGACVARRALLLCVDDPIQFHPGKH
jgi:hypothetical protein